MPLTVDRLSHPDEHIVEPLCRDIETDLRLSVHTGVVQLDDRNPFKVGMRDLSHFLKVGSIRWFDNNINIRSTFSGGGV